MNYILRQKRVGWWRRMDSDEGNRRRLRSWYLSRYLSDLLRHRNIDNCENSILEGRKAQRDEIVWYIKSKKRSGELEQRKWGWVRQEKTMEKEAMITQSPQDKASVLLIKINNCYYLIKLRFYSKGDGTIRALQAWEGKNLIHKIPALAEWGIRCGQSKRNQRRSLGRRLSTQLGSEMTWASDGGEGGERWSDKTWWQVGFIKEKLQCSCDKTFNGKTSSDRTVAQLVSLNSQFPQDRAFRTRGPQCFSTAPGAEVGASPAHCPHFTFPISSLITQ